MKKIKLNMQLYKKHISKMFADEQANICEYKGDQK